MTDQNTEQHNGSDYLAQPDEDLKLVKLYGLFQEKHEFHIGDIVEWKPGLRNKYTPLKKPLIVTKVYGKPILNQIDDSGNPYFREQLDIVYAQLHDVDLLEYHFDSKRLKPYETERQDND